MSITLSSKTQFLYSEVLKNFELADIEIAEILDWCKKPELESTPSISTALGLWTSGVDLTERIKELPQVQIYELEQRAIALDTFSHSTIEQKLVELDGYLIACEEHQQELFNITLNNQLTTALANWEEQIRLIEFCDEEELTEILQERDLLEYTRIGISIIRLEYPRLKDIQYVAFAKALKATDTAFRKSLNGATYPLPYADRTFWWRN